jgi:hypothetical protein
MKLAASASSKAPASAERPFASLGIAARPSVGFRFCLFRGPGNAEPKHRRGSSVDALAKIPPHAIAFYLFLF